MRLLKSLASTRRPRSNASPSPIAQPERWWPSTVSIWSWCWKTRPIWEIVPADLALPEDLKAGDEITIDFESAGESGVGKINSITRTGG